jgi:hypothetical protein
MAPQVRIGEFEDGQRYGEAIPSIDRQPRKLTRTQVTLGLTEVAHGAALIDRLRCRGALPEDRASVEWELADYGIRVIRSMIDSGEIFTRFRALTRGSLPDAAMVKLADEHVRSGLALDAVIEGVRNFCKRVQDGKWDPGHGASLATYCCNGCVLEFKRPYEKWLRSLREIPFDGGGDEELPSLDRDLQEQIAESLDLEHWRATLPARHRRIVDLTIAGQSARAIAEMTDYSPESIRRIRHQWRDWWTDHLRRREEDV